MAPTARYDGFAAWYDAHLAEFAGRGTPVMARLLGSGPGRCLELGCGGGIHLPSLASAGWAVVGVDVSRDQLRVARTRVSAPPRLVLADAATLPFAAHAFDAVTSAFTHTDVDDWNALVAEAARVLRSGGRFVYVGTHPCFVGPFSIYPGPDPPLLHAGYRHTERTTDAPGFGDGLRRRVGVRHVSLAALLNAFSAAGLVIEQLNEPGPEEYPRILAIAARRPARGV